MSSSNDKIISIDISSNKVKVGLVSDELELESTATQYYKVINEDADGFKKRFEMDEMWNKIKSGIKDILKKNKPEFINIIAVSSCAQRIAVVFLDKEGHEIYGGPNTDVRGIDSAYLIDDKYSEEDLFNITGHSPSLMFALARLLWFREEEAEQYEQIDKMMMLDDWIAYKLTGEFVSDFTSVPESQLFDVKKMEWSSEIIKAFDLNPEFFPKIVSPGTYVGDINVDFLSECEIKQKNIPYIKGGGDTLLTLLGMGAINDGDVGVSLGTTAPVDLITNEPIIDPELNFWTTCHPTKGKWILEANTGNTGNAYDWFKDAFFPKSKENVDQLIETYIEKVKPGASSTFAYLGPELMSFKDTTSIKRGVFIFQPPSMVSEELPKIEHFARSIFENLGFGIFENYKGLQNFAEVGTRVYCGGGMANSKGFCKILANIFNADITITKYKDTAFIGNAMNALIGTKKYHDYKSIVDKFFKFEKFPADPSVSKEYQNIYNEWKNFKNKVDEL